MEFYLRNAWYVAAWEHEVHGEALLARTLLDVPRVIYRKRDGGSYVMLKDRCPHRFAPLSLGERKGDSIACLYHGMEFGEGGRCTRNPFSSGNLPAHSVIDSPVVAAKHGLIWFWPGEAALANPTSIPDFSFLDGQNVWRRYSHFKGNYELLSDNLMDLSHVDFLHRKTFNTTGPHEDSRHELRNGDQQSIWYISVIPRARRFPVLEPYFAEDASIDQLTEMRWEPPASMMLRISWLPAGCEASDARFTMINPHIITPETAISSHYFWTCAPDQDSETFARAVFEGEDKRVIEAVQARMGDADFWDLKPMILKGDAGALRVRRRLMRLRREERGEITAQNEIE